ncbi:MAG: hypothetical protein NXI26_24200 [bacterium]|nr:hypothetical protein [bacterium]
MTTIVDFNAPRDVEYAHEVQEFERVLHIFDGGWHGIRSATGCLPGHKLAIDHSGPFDNAAARHAIGLIFKHSIDRVVFQGFSHRAKDLAQVLFGDFGDCLPMYVVTHVSASQFEHAFEMEMLKELFELKRIGIIKKVGSVKPGFGQAFESIDNELLINAPPNLRIGGHADLRDRGAVLVPVENTWRKNLYVNMLASLSSESVDHVYAVNQPSGLENLSDLKKVKVVGFMKPSDLLDFMASVAAVMNVTLIECQPMTKLEAVAVGTPCITGRLNIPGISEHPYGKLTEVEALDRPDVIRGYLDRILSAWDADASEMIEMAADYGQTCTDLCLRSYANFLEL